MTDSSNGVVRTVSEALPAMQELASRCWSAEGFRHPGQLAWSVGYGLPEDLDHGPVRLWYDGDLPVAYAWMESPTWPEVCVHPTYASLVPEVSEWLASEARDELATMIGENETWLVHGLEAAGWTSTREAPWMTQHTLDLSGLPPVPSVPGYSFRAISTDEAVARSACHRDAWEGSKVTEGAYRRLMTLQPYRPELDWVAQIEAECEGEMVASALVWLDESTGSALVEPVGTHSEHRGRGLAAAVSIAALTAARDLGGTQGLVIPRGDDDYPAPGRVYRSIGFKPGPRTVRLARDAPG
jgi:GNAT superfamily N-acetyltransferase